jgi:hypothetical protein
VADPFTIAAVVGGGAKVLGGIMQTNSQVGQLKTESAAEAENARRLGLQAGVAYGTGARNEEQFRREYRDFAGTQAAAIGEGSLSSTGSILDIVRQSEARANLDALKVRQRGVAEGQQLENEAGNARMRSSLARTMAKRARIAGTIGTVGDIAGAGSNIFQTRKASPK